MMAHRLRLTLQLAACLLLSPAAQGMPDAVAQDLQMAADSAPFRAAADGFIAHAMAGDLDGMLALLSRQLVARIGEPAARQALQAQIGPFFQRGGRPGNAVTVTRTTDAAGQPGFAFYMWLQDAAGGTARPFTVYVVREQGRLVVANLVPDRRVEGRHP